MPINAANLRLERLLFDTDSLVEAVRASSSFKKALVGMFAFALGGCEIERTVEGKERPGAAEAPAGDVAPAPKSLSEALSQSSKKKAPPEEPVPIVVEKANEPVQEEPTAPKVEELPQGATLDNLERWMSHAAWFDTPPAEPVRRALFVYGGGAPVRRLHLPPETPKSVLDGVVALTEQLEQSPLSNAGWGSARRLDGSIEVEAVLHEGGVTGAVSGVERIRTPIRLALALVRAGGAQIRGSAVETLAQKLGLELSSLETPASEEQYLFDLARYLARPAPQDNLALFHLFVDPSIASAALARTSEVPPAPPRNPVVVVFSGADDQLVVAASYGGRPLSLPGSPSLFREGSALRWDEKRVAFIAPEPECSFGAEQLLKPWSQLRFVVTLLHKECPSASYFVVGEGKVETNLSAEFFQQAAVVQAVEERPSAPPSSPGSTTSQAIKPSDPPSPVAGEAVPSKLPPPAPPKPTPAPSSPPASGEGAESKGATR